MRKMLSLGLLVCAAIVLTSCVAYKKSNELVFNEKERIQVKFETRKALELFHEKMAKKSRIGFEEKKEGWLVGVAYGEKTKFYKTYFFNEQVRLTDVNSDGVITEKEAEDYSKHELKPTTKE